MVSLDPAVLAGYEQMSTVIRHDILEWVSQWREARAGGISEIETGAALMKLIMVGDDNPMSWVIGLVHAVKILAEQTELGRLG